MASVFGWLDKPRLYQLAQKVVGLGSPATFSTHIQNARQGLPSPRRLLDVGCGPASLLSDVGLRPVGLDLSLSYVSALRATGCGAVVGSAAALPFPDAAFDETWTIGLLHHLDDQTAGTTVRELIRVTRPGGTTIIFDNVLPALRPWTVIPYALRKMDRGRFVRREAALVALLGSDTSWKIRRLKYSRSGLEGLMCVRAKAGRA